MNTSTQRRGRRFSSRGRKRSRSGGQQHNGFSNTQRRGSSSRNGRGRSRQVFDVSQYISKNIAPIDETPDIAENTFADFNLHGTLSKAIAACGFSAPTSIQDQIIPHVLRGTDVIGLSNTGTGKTAAFLIPLIDRTLQGNCEQTLILAPTRELAIQIEDELRSLTKGLRIHATVCVGGMNINAQIRGLRQKNDFIIGTPGRVIDLIARKKIHPEDITAVVLDEADRMLDMGFINDMRKILSGIPAKRHTMLFSATMSPSIQKLVHDFLRDPVTVSVKKQDITGSIEQDVVRVGNKEKIEVLLQLLANKEFTRVLIFGAMKHGVERLSKDLQKRGVMAESIHGNKSHSQRQRALKNFKSARARVLVATDVAARGIHVDEVSHVINYDLPTSYEDYVHRIGRTGRGVHRGKALTFVH